MSDTAVLEPAVSALENDLDVAQDEIAQNRPEAALAIWATLRRNFPDNPAAYLRAGSVLTKTGRYQEAESLLRAGNERFADNPGFLIERAWLAHARGDFAEAIRLWGEVREQIPNHHAGYSGAAHSLRQAERFGDAEQLLASAIAKFPKEQSVACDYASSAAHRRDWTQAVSRWAAVRELFPDQQAGYTGGAVALRESGMLNEAGDLLRSALVRFPGEPAPMIEYALQAHMQNDFAEAIRRWDDVRRQFPDHYAGYTGAANSLRNLKRFDEADQLLAAAKARFPTEPSVATEHAWLAHIRRDWPEAATRWADVRAHFSDQQAGYTAGALAHREMAQYDDAETILQSALEKFPGHRTPIVEHAWLATARRNWPEAARRWKRVREKFPELTIGYQRGAAALTELWQYKEAEALLTEGIQRFPRESELLSDFAWIALLQRRDDEAAERFKHLRELFPNVAAGYIGGAHCLRNQFRLHDSEQLLERGHALVPEDPRILLERAQIPIFPPLRRDRNYDETFRRLEALRTKFPQFEEGYTFTIRFLRDDDRLGEADAFGKTATQQLPHSSALAVDHAHTARALSDWPEALRRYADVRERFPQQPAGVTGLASVLSSTGKHEEADAVLREAVTRFPLEKAVFAEFGSVAVRQHLWKEALARWTEAYRRFPDANEFAQRIFEARLRLTESDMADAEEALLEQSEANPSDPRAEMREMILQFESLGGRGLGCEFGMFQREFAVEPLGLLRWADMPYDGIIFTLESRFEGVGHPENTRLFLDRERIPHEYCICDKRGFLFQRCFILEDDISYDKMWKQILRRIPFLRDKLIADLEACNKIFVWRQTDRDLTDAELDRLHRAVRSYGDNTLLYVRYQDVTHPNGTVECTAPGLLIGYIDRFKQLPTGELAATPASASWTAICRKAFMIWKQPAF